MNRQNQSPVAGLPAEALAQAGYRLPVVLSKLLKGSAGYRDEYPNKITPPLSASERGWACLLAFA